MTEKKKIRGESDAKARRDWEKSREKVHSLDQPFEFKMPDWVEELKTPKPDRILVFENVGGEAIESLCQDYTCVYRHLIENLDRSDSRLDLYLPTRRWFYALGRQRFPDVPSPWVYYAASQAATKVINARREGVNLLGPLTDPDYFLLPTFPGHFCTPRWLKKTLDLRTLRDQVVSLPFEFLPATPNPDLPPPARLCRSWSAYGVEMEWAEGLSAYVFTCKPTKSQVDKKSFIYLD